jgi:deoxyribonuclease-4
MSHQIGAHVSINGGYSAAAEKAGEMGCNTFQMFAVSPMARGIPMISDDDLWTYQQMLGRYKIQTVYFHASYLVNFADPERVGANSVEMLSREMTFASRMNVKGCIVHLGSFKEKKEVGLFDEPHANFPVLIENIKKVLDNSPENSYFLAENAGNRKIGKDLEELARIVEGVNNPRLRICLDTCHLYSAGYDIVKPDETDKLLEWFDTRIGLDKLEVIHLNDSRDPFGSFRDRHENIGEGTLDIETFRYWINHPKLASVPFILEVPGLDKKGPDKHNVDLVKSLIKK